MDVKVIRHKENQRNTIIYERHFIQIQTIICYRFRRKPIRLHRKKYMLKVLIATNNPSKLSRVRLLSAGMNVECLSPADLGLPVIETEEGSTIAVNAEQKARAYANKTDQPILGMDSAFVIPGEDLDPAKARRNALAGRDESTMTRQEIAQAMIAFYVSIVERRGEPVSAYWEDAFALLLPDGTVRHTRDQRPVILTKDVHGSVDPHFPLRSLYIVAPTGKYVADQTPQEQLIEFQPFTNALQQILHLPVSFRET